MLLIFFLKEILILDVEDVSFCPILLDTLDCYFLCM